MKRFLSAILAAFTVGTVSADSSQRRGAVCFTFDDYGGQNWIKADKIFKKYDAHATFFVVREITAEKAEVMKTLQAAGHTVGLHTMKHRNANPLPRGWNMEQYIKDQVLPQLEACEKFDIKVRSFAYPNNRRTEKTDQALYKYFDYLRAGWGKSKQPVYTPLAELPEKMVLGGGGIGDVAIRYGYQAYTYEQDQYCCHLKKCFHASSFNSSEIFPLSVLSSWIMSMKFSSLSVFGLLSHFESVCCLTPSLAENCSCVSSCRLSSPRM